jgi:HEPN domain-containing protein
MKEITRSWIEFAKRDFRNAEKEVNDEYLSNIVTFHSHQFVEKLLKALLSENEIFFPKVHDISKLYNLLPGELKHELNVDEDNLLKINEVYIESRYPSELGLLPSGFPTKEQAELIFEISSSIYYSILKYMEKEK